MQIAIETPNMGITKTQSSVSFIDMVRARTTPPITWNPYLIKTEKVVENDLWI